MSKPLTGVFPEMTNDEHHSHDAIGSSGLKLIAKTPFHYWAQYRDPNRKPRAQTKALRIGSMVHTATLEPHLFDETFTVLPEGLDRRTTEGKRIWAEIVATNKEPLTDAEFQDGKAMAEAVHRHPVTRVLFERCQAQTEVSIFWVDTETGVNCKIRPDIMVEPCSMFPNGLLADLKTTEDASPVEFAKSVWNWEMHLQAAIYPEGFMAAFGTQAPPDFLWLAQEKSAPYANKYYACTPELSAYGMKEVNRLRRIYADCLQADRWPAYPPEVEPIALPAWADKVVKETISI